MNIFSKLHLSENAKKITENIGWAVLGKVVTLLGSFIVGVFVARYLGPEQYGLMNYVVSYVAIFQAFALFGMDNIEIREEAKCKDDRDVIIGTAFVLKLVFAAITILLIFILLQFSDSSIFVRRMIMLYSFSIVCNCFFVVRNHFTSIVWNEYVVKTEIFRTIVGILIKIFLLIMHAELGWFIAAVTFDYVLLASGYCLSYSRKIDKIRLWRFDRKWAKYLIKQSFPLMLSLSAVVVMQRIDQLMINKMISSESLGQYSVAFKFVEVMVFIPTIIAQTVSPILVRIRKENENDYLCKSQIFTNLTLWICLLMAVVVCLIAHPLIKFTFGEQYMSAVPVLQIMAFKVVGDAFSQTSGQMIIIEGKQIYAVIRNLVGCLFCILLNFLLIPKMGIIGSSMVSVITVFVSGFLVNALIPKYKQIFLCQVKAFLFGWKDLFNIKNLMK